MGELQYFTSEEIAENSWMASWKTALSSGFTPAWIEVESRKNNDDKFAK